MGAYVGKTLDSAGGCYGVQATSRRGGLQGFSYISSNQVLLLVIDKIMLSCSRVDALCICTILSSVGRNKLVYAVSAHARQIQPFPLQYPNFSPSKQECREGGGAEQAPIRLPPTLLFPARVPRPPRGPPAALAPASEDAEAPRQLAGSGPGCGGALGRR